MDPISTIAQKESARRRAIVDQALTDVEAFRSQAAKALTLFSRDERRTLAQLEIESVTSYDVLLVWQNKLAPLRAMLHGKRSDKAFKAQLAKHLALEDGEVQLTTNRLVDKRRDEILDNCIDDLYPAGSDFDDYRDEARDLLSLTDKEIQTLKDHFVDAVLHREVAQQYGIRIVDSHSSWLSRSVARRRIRKQRKQTTREEKRRLRFIERRVKELRSMEEGLVGELLGDQFDLMTILALRNQYEKAIGRLTKANDTPLKRLAIFEKETKVFREQALERMLTKTSSLEEIRRTTGSINELLVRVFDLSATQKNRLLAYSKEYRELTQEKTAIMLARQARKK